MALLAECYRRLTDKSSSESPLKGYKVTDVNHTRKIGVACRSLLELKEKACAKLNITEDLAEVGIFLIDGSEIDEEYFGTLQPQTTLILRRPGEKLLTEADVLYQMLKKVNKNAEKLDETKSLDPIADKLKLKIAMLNKLLNETGDDTRTMCSGRGEHPEWFDGLESGSQTKESYLHRRCQDRIRGYLYKAIEQIRGSDAYQDANARKQLQNIIVFFKLQLRKDHYFGYYFDRSRAPDHLELSSDGENTTDDETDSADTCPYEHCPCRLDFEDYERFILGLDDEIDEVRDEVDARKLAPRTPVKRDQEGNPVANSITKEQQSSRARRCVGSEREEFAQAEEACIYKLVERNARESKALCDRYGEFRCDGVWNQERCAYEDKHRINPYRSREELVLFSTWNLDHKIERSRTIVPQLLEASLRGEIKQKDAVEFYQNLFTTKNLRLVHIVCHDKGAHK